MIVVLTVVKNINVTLMGSTSESWESWRNDAFFLSVTERLPWDGTQKFVFYVQIKRSHEGINYVKSCELIHVCDI